MREFSIERNTKETAILLNLTLDGQGNSNINTGIGFFDHMLQLFACHSKCDLTITCNGDLKVDAHHSVEDVGICLGKAIKSCLGDKLGINRYGSFTIPMDETLASVDLDLSGRPYLVFNAKLSGKVGDFDMELLEEFFYAISTNCGMNLHINLQYGTNNHHKAEAIFKAFARALKQAVQIVGDSIPSSKGILE